MTALERYTDALRRGAAEELDEETLLDIAEKYPYFIPAATEALKRSDLSPDVRTRLMTQVALNSADREALFKVADPAGPHFAEFYPSEAEPSTPTTDAAIDTFLDKYGTADPREEALLTRLIFNPVPDYSTVLEKEHGNDSAGSESTGQDAMLDAFLANRNEETQKTVEPAEEIVPVQHGAELSPPSPESSLSESLSKIYIKQHRYDKAYEIIKQLSLTFPEKSIYFADQLRFLRKLILNQRYINNNN